MAQGQAVLGQEGLCFGAAQTWLQGGRHRLVIHLDESLHPSQIQAHYC